MPLHRPPRCRASRPLAVPLFVLSLLLALPAVVAAAEPPEHGGGPYPRLVLRGVTLVDGTGAPPRGPVDLVLEGGRIAEIASAGAPGAPADPADRPDPGPDGRELDLAGAWVLPGFVDLFAHPGGHRDYAWKLWLAHGVTTVREPVCLSGMEACLELVEASRRGEVVAPSLVPWLYFGIGAEEPLDSPGAARRWVAGAAERGARGIKFRSGPPEVLFAALEEAERRGLATSCHHTPLHVARADALHTARRGLDLVEHWYGLPEALLPPGAVQDFPLDHNHADEGKRFAAAGRLWAQAAPPGSEHRRAVVDELVERGVALLPTLALYEANRDWMRVRRAEWHDEYTLPELWDSFRPSRRTHAAHLYAWTTEDEVAWRRNFRLWMEFLAEYAEAGGRVVTGSDPGFMYNLHGFGYVRELELLREAGFHPLEVVRAATLWSAEELGVEGVTGSVEVGKRADLVVVTENPLADLKVLYGTGAVRLDDDGRPVRVGGVAWTVKGGRTYEGARLLAEVRQMVRQAREEAGREELHQPGMAPRRAGVKRPEEPE